MEIMDDLISRAAAIKKLKSLLYETAFNSAEQHRDATLYADIADNRIEIWLNLIPAVDAVPVVHAKWIEYPLCLGYVGAYSKDHIVCSSCKKVWSIIYNDTERFDYCPACGAKMMEG